jgi:predicted XRE-type DNA-binding protein
MKNEPRITEGSGNVYADLGLPDPDVALAKANLAIRIKQSIEQQNLTQIQAAKLLGVDQAKVSALVCGRLSGFSTDRLFRFLNALGRDVEIIIRPKPASHKQGHVSVSAF